MILKGSQRGGPRQLAAHLMRLDDNEHVTIREVRGFVASDLPGAMTETVAIAKGTRCRQPIFSLSLNPPKDADASVEDLKDAADRAEAALGLQGQPRVLVIHEKSGRRHAHVVWSRIDPEKMTAVQLSFFKTKLNALSKELYLEHGWDLPEGHRSGGWKNPLNFTLAEWQQAKRIDLDPREIKQVFRDAWMQSDNLASFAQAMEDRGYYLAKGDRRGIVAVDVQGEVYAVARYASVKTKDLSAKLGNGENLPAVGSVQADLAKRISKRVRAHLADDRKQKQAERAPLKDAIAAMVVKHRNERALLRQRQAARQRAEAAARAGRFRRGLGMVLDLVSGRLFALRKQNEKEAFDGYRRDGAQREALYDAQKKDLAPLLKRLGDVLHRQRTERQVTAQSLVDILRLSRGRQGQRSRGQPDHDIELDLEP